MYILLEVEVKNSIRNSELEYVNEDILDKYNTLEEAKEGLDNEIERTVKRGFFNLMSRVSDYRALLHNGGSYYKLLSIMKVGA